MTIAQKAFKKDDPLYVLFEKFSQFGNKTVYTADSAITMKIQAKDPMILDGSRFVKLFKDAGLVDGKVITTTELDIVFNKVKGKNERKINFAQFRQACKLLARKKYGVSMHNPTEIHNYLQDSNETITDADVQEAHALASLDEYLLKCPGPVLVATTVYKSSYLISFNFYFPFVC